MRINIKVLKSLNCENVETVDGVCVYDRVENEIFFTADTLAECLNYVKENIQVLREIEVQELLNDCGIRSNDSFYTIKL